ncbi:hypothetical protein AMEX_G27814 [Astyanax mexicanus]|uniref:Uncharacterized protein n=1 Tax=Astyanax mexicanus TaxID=7994 RepID=A0A8T2KI72_ASTMX|nr:hypothetical protein AMEX_G27814 [Astyanax mexicanus]
MFHLFHVCTGGSFILECWFTVYCPFKRLSSIWRHRRTDLSLCITNREKTSKIKASKPAVAVVRVLPHRVTEHNAEYPWVNGSVNGQF